MLKKLSLIVVSLYLSAICSMALAQTTAVKSVKKINPTTVEVRFDGGERMMLDFYGKNIFRVFQDNSGGIIREPEAKPEAVEVTEAANESVPKPEQEELEPEAEAEESAEAEAEAEEAVEQEEQEEKTDVQ